MQSSIFKAGAGTGCHWHEEESRADRPSRVRSRDIVVPKTHIWLRYECGYSGTTWVVGEGASLPDGRRKGLPTTAVPRVA